jgi:hypothetical protein
VPWATLVYSLSVFFLGQQNIFYLNYEEIDRKTSFERHAIF